MRKGSMVKAEGSKKGKLSQKIVTISLYRARVKVYKFCGNKREYAICIIGIYGGWTPLTVSVEHLLNVYVYESTIERSSVQVTSNERINHLNYSIIGPMQNIRLTQVIVISSRGIFMWIRIAA